MKSVICLYLLLLLAGNVSAKEIIHLADYHYVNREDFTASVRTVRPDATDKEIGDEYVEFLKDVEQIQAQQMQALRKLVKELGVQTVYAEGYVRPISQMRWTKHLKKPPKKPVTAFDQFMAEQRQHDLLGIGAAGKLYLAGELDDVLPCETLESLKVADPVTDGRVILDREQLEARENQMLARILESDKEVIVIVLGAAHDLSNNVPGEVGVKRIEVPVLKKLVD